VRSGYTPFHDTEERDMKQLLAETFSPALEASVPGSLVTATTSLQHDTVEDRSWLQQRLYPDANCSWRVGLQTR
jgi:hypothetical protein